VVVESIRGLNSKSKKPKIEKQGDEEFLTRTEVSKKLKINISTVHHWTKKGVLKAYTFGRRKYYLMSDIKEKMTAQAS